MFSMMGSGNNTTLRENPRFLAIFTALRGISGSMSLCLPIPRDLDSEIFRREICGLSIPVVSRRSVVAQSFEVRLLLVGISLLLVLMQQDNSSFLTGVRTVGEVVLFARTLLRVKARRQLADRLFSITSRVQRSFMAILRSVTVRRIVSGVMRC
jgi:hypothetical protein